MPSKRRETTSISNDLDKSKYITSEFYSYRWTVRVVGFKEAKHRRLFSTDKGNIGSLDTYFSKSVVVKVLVL